MLIRKKALKIQERLGMNLGVSGGVSSIPVIETTDQAMEVLREMYKVGLRALVLPPEFFANIKDTTELYKEYYGDLLRLKNIAKKFGIELSLRKPSLPEIPDDELRLYATIASVMDARIFTIQPNFYSRMPQDQALKLAVYKINEIVNELRVNAKIGIETTGRVGELGSIEDVIEICKRTTNTEPVINWAHVHARGAGFLKTPEDFKKIIEQVKEGVGGRWVSEAFFFFSGIRYGNSGEICHTSFLGSDMKLEHLIRSILSYGMKGTVIFEDPEKEKNIVTILDELGDMVR